MEREKVMTDQQKVSDLCSILDELFNSFQPSRIPGLNPGAFFECILGHNHLDRLKAEYAEIKKED